MYNVTRKDLITNEVVIKHEYKNINHVDDEFSDTTTDTSLRILTYTKPLMTNHWS